MNRRQPKISFKMLNLRGSSFTENGIGEPEQDANSALTELDKGNPHLLEIVILIITIVFRAPLW